MQRYGPPFKLVINMNQVDHGPLPCSSDGDKSTCQIY
jgi:hypothetical protein